MAEGERVWLRVRGCGCEGEGVAESEGVAEGERVWL